MSNFLGGGGGLGYRGTKAQQPPNCVFAYEDPTVYDVAYSLLDIWLNQTTNTPFILVSLKGTSLTQGSRALWLPFSISGNVRTLTGDTGSPVGPDFPGNINIKGDGSTIFINGNPGTNTLTITAAGGAAATEFDTDSGNAVPLLGVLNINGGNNITTSGAGNTVTIDVTGTTDHAVQLGTSAGALNSLSLGLAGQILQSQGAAADPAWTLSMYPTANNQGDLIYGAATDVYTNLPKDTNATRYLSNTGASNNPAWAQINLTNGVTGILPIINGGTNASTFSNTDGVVYFDGTRLVTTAVGNATDVLTSNGPGLPPTFQPGGGGGGGGGIALTSGFLAIQEAPVANVTGDGTVYSLGASQALTTIFDINGDISDGDGLGTPATFTAPFTAKYYLEISVQLTNLQTGEFNDSIGTYSIVTPARTFTFEFSPLGLFNANAMVSSTGSVSQGAFVNLSAGDICTFNCMSNLNGAGGVADIGVGGASDPAQTYISGFIVTGGGGSNTVNYTNVTTTPYVVLPSDQYLSVDTSALAITIQLPNAATKGRTFIIKDRIGDAATRNITVTTVGGAVLIDGATTFTLNTAYESIQLVGNGTSYEIY